MAIDATVVWEMRTDGSNSNGGGFKPGASGTDYSQQNAAQYALTSATSAGAGAVILHASAAADMVGNILKVVSGTNFTVGWYEIISVVVGVSITVDRDVTTGIGANGVVNVGGAVFSDSDDFYEQLIGGQTVWVKSGTYTQTASLAVSNTSPSSSLPVKISGYNVSRGDNPTGSNRPVFNCATFTFNFTSDDWRFRDIITTGTLSTVATMGTSRFYNVKFVNTSGTAARAAVRSNNTKSPVYTYCEFTSTLGIGCTNSTAIEGGRFFFCYFHDGTHGFYGSNVSLCEFLNCLFVNLSSAGIATANILTGGGIIGCTFVGNGSTGTAIDIEGTASYCTIRNNIFYNWNFGIEWASGYVNGELTDEDFNDFFNNGTDVVNIIKGDNDLALDPQFTDAGGGDYSIGTNLKAKGFPSGFPGLSTTTSYFDIGAVQRQESGVASSTSNGRFGRNHFS